MMLDDPLTRGGGRSLPPKLAACITCSAPIAYRTSPKLRCDPCWIDNRRARDRAKYEIEAQGKRRLKDTICCEVCGCSMLRGSGLKRYCAGCAKRAIDRASKLKKRESRISSGQRVIGQQADCQACGAQFLDADSGRRKYCEPCRKSHIATRLSAKRRRASDPTFVLHERVKRALYKRLRTGRNGKKWEQILGYSLEQLRAHLEKQFVKGMSWENRSLWHIDHILPLAGFKFTSMDDPEFKAAWALTNLRPLWAPENAKKQATRTLLL